MRLAYGFKSLLRSNIRLALSSDAPVEPLDPNETIRAALSKRSQPSCNQFEALSMREVLKAYSRFAVEASRGPLIYSGIVSKGFKADILVSKVDLLVEERIEPIETIVSGLRSTVIINNF
ncbi:MAG: amidohydrolase family protein [Acidilobaceae archaeon]